MIRINVSGMQAPLYAIALWLVASIWPVNSAWAANCWCDLKCTSSDGKSFNKYWSAGSGYIAPLGANKCNAACAENAGAQISQWAKDGNVCGKLTCQGTSMVGEAGVTRQNSGPFVAERTCPGNPPPAGDPHAACCPPGSSVDVSSIFKQVQTNDVNDPYKLTYTPSQDPNYDAVMQAYFSYVKAVNPQYAYMRANYYLHDVTNSALPVLLAGGYVDYAPAPSASGVFFAPSQPLAVNKTYAVSRVIEFWDPAKKAWGRYYDSRCKDRGFKFSIVFVPLKSANPGGSDGAMAVVKIEGQPDRTVPFVRSGANEPARQNVTPR